MNKPFIEILCLFDYATNTGYATVSKNLVSRLRKYYGDRLKLTICAVNFFPKKKEDGSFDMTTASYFEDPNTFVFSAQFYKGRQHKAHEDLTEEVFFDKFGRNEFMDALSCMDFSGIFILSDLGNIAPIIPILNLIKNKKLENKKPSFKSIIYFPIDSDNMNPKRKNDFFDLAVKQGKQIPEALKDQEYIDIFKHLNFFDLAVTFTEFGRQQVLKHQPSLAGKIKVIPHGVNPDDFFPIYDIDFKSEYFGTNHNMDFIIGCINRNQFRKDIPTVIMGFIELKKIWGEKELAGWKRPFLYLHMNPKDPHPNSWDLRYVLSQTDLVEGKDYMFPPESAWSEGTSVETLNCIYGCLDCSVNVATGGGWELTVTESMQCMVPCIVPAHTSLLELSGNGSRALILKELYPICSIADNIFRYQCNAEELAEKILELALPENNAKKGEMIEKAHAWTQTITWDAIFLNYWKPYFENLFGKP